MVAVKVQYRHETHPLVNRDEQSQTQPPPPTQNRPSSASDSPNATILRVKEIHQRKPERLLEGVLRPQKKAKAGYTSTAAFNVLSTFHSTHPLTTVLKVPYCLQSPQCSLVPEPLPVFLQHEHESKARSHICSFSPYETRLPCYKILSRFHTLSSENDCYDGLSL